MATIINIGGVERPVLFGWTIDETTNGASTFSGSVLSMDGAYNPNIGNELTVIEDSVLVFAGLIDAPSRQGMRGKGIEVVTSIQATGFDAYIDRRVIGLTIPAGSTLLQALQILAPYLTPYGISLSVSQATGPTITTDLHFSARPLREAFDRLTEVTEGWVYKISYTKILSMTLPSSTAAPFNVVDGDGHAIGDITVEEQQDLPVNLIHVLGGSGQQAMTDSYVAGVGQTVFELTYSLAPQVDQGLVQVGVALETIAGVGMGGMWEFETVGGVTTITRVAGALVGGEAVSWTYLAQFPHQVTATTSPAPAPANLHERVKYYPQVFDEPVLQLIAGSLIARHSVVRETVRYETAEVGAHPGQTQTITCAKRGLNGTFIIVDVRAKNLEPGVTHREITAVTGTLFPGSWRDDELWQGSTGTPSASTGGDVTIISGGSGATGTGTAGNLTAWATSTTLGDASSIPSALQDTITRTSTLVSGATGAGFTVNLGVSTISGRLVAANLFQGSALSVLGVTGGALADHASIQAGTDHQVLRRSGTAVAFGAVNLAQVAAITGRLPFANLAQGSALSVLGVTGNATADVASMAAGTDHQVLRRSGTAVAFGAVNLSQAAATTENLLYARMPSGAGTWTAVPTISGAVTLQSTLAVAGNADFSGHVGHPSYASQTTQWRIDATGGADFRYLFTDELHAKSFIADLEQALAGGQIICKSVAMVGAAFTVPAAGAAATLTVRDLPSAENMAAFESGDYVVLRSFSRAAGSLTIADAVGVVTVYTDLAGGLQTWTWTRASGGSAGTLAAGTVIAVDSIALDYGVSGNGYYEVNAVDGAYGVNSPYAQIVTWATAPVAANRTVRARFGKLTGITSSANEFGMLAGTYAASNGQYFRASNAVFELHGIDLTMWDGTTSVIALRRNSGSPYLAIGTPAPSTFGSGAGIWMGKDAGAYKFRVGNPGTSGLLAWDGTNLTAAGWLISPDRIQNATGLLRLISGGSQVARIEVGTGYDVNTSGINSAGEASGAEITFWSGATHANRATAPFRVTLGGAITATSGVVGGWTLASTSLTGGAVTLHSSNGIAIAASSSSYEDARAYRFTSADAGAFGVYALHDGSNQRWLAFQNVRASSNTAYTVFKNYSTDGITPRESRITMFASPGISINYLELACPDIRLAGTPLAGSNTVVGITGSLSATGTIAGGGGVPFRVPNNSHYYGYNASSSAVALIGIDSSNRTHLTCHSNALVINSIATGGAGAFAEAIAVFINGVERRIQVYAVA